MKGLFARIYLDEDVAVLVAHILRASGFEVEITSELYRKGRKDPDQLSYASENEMAILTHNRTDFEDLANEYFEQGRSHHGIIISVLRPPQDISRQMIELLNRFTADEMRNQVMYI